MYIFRIYVYDSAVKTVWLGASMEVRMCDMSSCFDAIWYGLLRTQGNLCSTV